MRCAKTLYFDFVYFSSCFVAYIFLQDRKSGFAGQKIRQQGAVPCCRGLL